MSPRHSRHWLRRLCTVAACVLAGSVLQACTEPQGALAITGIEVVQTVQTAGNDIPLVANKRTYVRVYPSLTPFADAQMVQLTASLTVSGRTEVLTPIRSPEPAAGVVPNRADLTRGFLFELPDTSPGTRTITATVSGPGTTAPTGTQSPTRQLSVTFGPPAPALQLLLIRYRYTDVPPQMSAWLAAQPGVEAANGSTWGPQPREAFTEMTDLAANLLPFGDITVRRDEITYDVPCEAIQKDGAWSCGAAYEAGSNEGLRRLNETCRDGGCFGVVLQPERSHGTGWCCANESGNTLLRVSPEITPDDRGRALAHEIAHAYGLKHTPEVHYNPEITVAARPHDTDGAATHLPSDAPRAVAGCPDFNDCSYPVANGAMDKGAVGLQTVPAIRIHAAPDAHDLMSYSGTTRWTSAYSYCRLLAITSDSQVTCPAELTTGK